MAWICREDLALFVIPNSKTEAGCRWLTRALSLFTFSLLVGCSSAPYRPLSMKDITVPGANKMEHGIYIAPLEFAGVEGCFIENTLDEVDKKKKMYLRRNQNCTFFRIPCERCKKTPHGLVKKIEVDLMERSPYRIMKNDMKNIFGNAMKAFHSIAERANEDDYDIKIIPILKGFKFVIDSISGIPDHSYRGDVVMHYHINLTIEVQCRRIERKRFSQQKEKLIAIFNHSMTSKKFVTDDSIHYSGLNGYKYEPIDMMKFIREAWCSGVYKMSHEFMPYFGNEYYSSPEIQKTEQRVARLKRQQIEKNTSPSSLVTALRFDDQKSLLPNNAIDALENSELVASISNEGKGTAFGVKIKVESSSDAIVFNEEMIVGDIEPGASKSETIHLKPNQGIETGTAKLLIQTLENRGYNARPVEIHIPTKKLLSPELLFASLGINDASGLADGDGDRKIENNETIEINPFIQNSGVGEALKVTVKLKDVSDGIEIVRGEDRMESIPTGITGKSSLSFRVPRTFNQPEIKYTVVAADIRGMKAEKTYTIPFESSAPRLNYAYQVVDRANNETPGLKNGESYILKITPKNVGDNIAENVALSVSAQAGGISLGTYNGSIGKIPPGSFGGVVNVPLTLQRTFGDAALQLNVAMTQDGFDGYANTIQVPVMVSRPKLEYAAALINGVDQKSISQNSWPRIRVSVSNTGTMDAENVKVALKVDGIGFHKEEAIGTIRAGENQYKDFTFFVRGDAKTGDLPFSVQVTQNDFDDLRQVLAYQVVEQKAVVQMVQGLAGSSSGMVGMTYSGPPELYLNSPNDNAKTIEKQINLHGSVMTFGAGNAAQEFRATLNGVSMPVIPVNDDIKLEPNHITQRKVEDNKVIFDGTVLLKPGENILQISCADRNGRQNSKTIKIFKQARLGNIYAVVVGVSKFADSRYDLQYAASDAEKFHRFLRSEAGGKIPDSRIRLLTDAGATRANVIGTITGLLGRSSKDDTVEIYLATHGYVDLDGTFYYLCHDTDIDNLRGTGFSDEELTTILNKNIKAGKVILYLDACHSGQSGLDEKRYAKRSIGVKEVNDKINGLAAALSRSAKTGVMTFSASSSQGYSLEDSQWSGGIFTHYLVKGLQGEANENDDEWVNIGEIDSYLSRKIVSETAGKQRPKVNGTLVGTTPLAKVR